LIHDYILADEHMGNSVFTFHIFGLCDHFLNKLSEINQPNLFSFPFSLYQWFDFLNYGIMEENDQSDNNSNDSSYDNAENNHLKYQFF